MLAGLTAYAETAGEAVPAPDWGDITLDAQIRTRAEYRNGQGSLKPEGIGPTGFVNDRVRFNVGWERKNLAMHISLQHVGVWGDASQTSKAGNINLHEAWAKLKFGDERNSGFLQLGRQVLSYDDERLLGGLDWAASGRAHDALRIGGQLGEYNSLHAFGTYSNNSESNTFLATGYDNAAGYQHMEGFWYHYALDKRLGISFLFLNTGIMNTALDEEGKRLYPGTYNLQTAGIHLTGSAKGFSATFSAYGQTGKSNTDKAVMAYLLSATAQYRFNEIVSLGAGDDNISGSDGTDGKQHTFNVLYGTHHKFYGAMDYFNNSNMPAQGLNDLYGNIAVKPCKPLSMSLAYHWLATNHRIADCPKTLGHELDLQINWTIVKDVTLQAGYSMMLPTSAMQQIKRVAAAKPYQDWAWLSLNVSPRIFTTKK